MESELEDVLTDIRSTVGELSDLRYGRLSQLTSGENVRDELLVAVKRLESACANASPT